MDNLQHQFRLPIGDWSDDGHGQVEYFLISSNANVKDVREVHYQIEETTGINLEQVCRKYEDNVIKEDVVDMLHQLGFDFQAGGFEDDNEHPDALGMARLWVFLLQQTDSSLKLRIEHEKKPPMLPFYGRDERQRHISSVGYGIFN